ncbi:MAG: flagellar biosynthesis protein FlhB [Treponema lecithinolyticum]|uniref:flagellar biosynthesis protein FlhB n=1 Tax=Treponema lecithinolyticum TaxID=53418 RepID=UPI003FA2F6A9
MSSPMSVPINGYEPMNAYTLVNGYTDEHLIYFDLQWFAAEDEGRTEQPSEYKLRKAREEGRVAKSQELNGALVMLLPVLTLIVLSPWLFKKSIEIIRFYFERCTQAQLNGMLVRSFFHYFIAMVSPVCIAALIAGISANLIQNKGFMFSLKPIEPKFSKVLPHFGEYFRKTLFSFEGAFNVFKSLLKVIVVFICAYITIKNDLPKLLSLLNVNLWNGIVHIAVMSAKLLIIASFIFLIISIPDYLVQRRQFIESMKMTKQEVKEEFKTLEGDPLVKSRLRQIMRELMRGNIRENVAKADVVITNPTHFAVAVLYDKEVMQGPMVCAKGQDALAQRIKEIARENDVTLIENRPLARALYAEVEIGDIIPETYYTVLATILGKVYAMKGKKI